MAAMMFIIYSHYGRCTVFVPQQEGTAFAESINQSINQPINQPIMLLMLIRICSHFLAATFDVTT